MIFAPNAERGEEAGGDKADTAGSDDADGSSGNFPAGDSGGCVSGSCGGVCCGNTAQQGNRKTDGELGDGLVCIVCGVADGDAAGCTFCGVDVVDAGKGYGDHFEVVCLPDGFCGIRGVCDDNNVRVAGSAAKLLRVGCPGRVTGEAVSGADEICGEFLYAGVRDADWFKEDDVHGMLFR